MIQAKKNRKNAKSAWLKVKCDFSFHILREKYNPQTIMQQPKDRP
jgi:hypothetical protein